LRSNGPKGGCQGWQAIKNCMEQFLTSRSDGPQGGRQPIGKAHGRVRHAHQDADAGASGIRRAP
jgi:hypothetical protein